VSYHIQVLKGGKWVTESTYARWDLADNAYGWRQRGAETMRILKGRRVLHTHKVTP
jgi:hypothetical protein